MWTESPATFHGQHYSIEHACCEPRPDPIPRSWSAVPADAVEQLRPLVELGVIHFMINPHSFRTLERFCLEVPPELGRLGG